MRRRTPFGSSGSLAMHDYLALATQPSTLSALAILDVASAGRYTLMTPDAAEPIRACRVSAEFFAALGVSPVRGRLFTNGDDAPGRALTAVIRHAFYCRQRLPIEQLLVIRVLVLLEGLVQVANGARARMG
jgi:hypothetical protein